MTGNGRKPGQDAVLTPAYRPLYLQIREAFTRRMASGDWSPGMLLPSEMALAQEYGVSQGTIRKALDAMAADRMIVRHQGRGTEVARHDDERALHQFFHIVGHDGRRQLPVSSILSCSLEQAVEHLTNPEFAMAKSKRNLSGQLRQQLGTWEMHASGWLQAPLPLCVLRYEAMKADPLCEFRRAVRFMELPHDDTAITAALEASRFERLQEAEQAQRFREAPTSTRTFFRRGISGEGLDKLTPKQRAPLEAMLERIEALIAQRGLSA